MKVVQSRKEHPCGLEHCCLGKIIPRNSIAVTQILKGQKGYFVLYFHPDCFIQSIVQYINKLKEALEVKMEKRKAKKNKPKGKQGRPRKYTNPLKARNKKQLLKHHQKAGNTDRVGELEEEIKGLEVGR